MMDYEEDNAYFQGHTHVQGQVTQTYTTKIPPGFNGKTSWFAYEDAVLDWIAHLSFVMRRKVGTVKGKIGHIGTCHIEEGQQNPIDSVSHFEPKSAAFCSSHSPAVLYSVHFPAVRVDRCCAVTAFMTHIGFGACMMSNNHEAISLQGETREQLPIR